MKFRPYSEYKASGVAWLRDLPEGWTPMRLKAAAQLRDRKVEADLEAPLPYIGLENIESWTGHLRPIDEMAVPTGTANAFQKTHTLFGKLRPYLAKACNPEFDGLCSTELLVLEPTELDRRNLLYSLLCDGFIEFVDSSTFGSKMPRANWDFIGNCVVPVPPADEQRAIADFLDRETARLNRLVGKKRQLIEKLKEKRTALISRIVTRGLPAEAAARAGLNPHPKLKPSGIEWLGDIPEHWEVVRLSRVTISRCDGPFGSGLKSEHYVDDGVRVTRLQNIRFARFDGSDAAYIEADYYKELGDHTVLPGDLLIAGLGDESHPVGRACVAPPDLGPAMVKADCFRFRLADGKATASFIAYQLSATARDLAGALATGTTRSRMNLSDTAARMLAVPDVREQRAIADYLDRETAKLDRLTEKVEAAIEKLQEYRTALITAAVTGKVDVRNALASAHL